MRILALDAALSRSAVALVIDGNIVSERHEPGRRDHAALLPPMAEAVFAEAGLSASGLDGIAVTVGPGSFTGLRAAIALAQGLALAAGTPVVGVTLTEAMASALPRLGGRALWVAIDSRRGRIFLDRGDGPVSTPLDALPRAGGRMAVAGDAAIPVAAALAAGGQDVMLTDLRLPPIRHVAEIGARRLRGELASLPAQPLYIDPPEARLPAGGLRPPPLAR